jgi:hypothetical protein
MLTQYAPGRFGAHDLLCRFAYQESMAHDSSETRTEAVLRLMEHYLHSALAAARQVDPHRNPADLPGPRPGVEPETFASAEAAMTWLRNEEAELIATVEQAVCDGLDVGAWTPLAALIPGLRPFLGELGHSNTSATE